MCITQNGAAVDVGLLTATYLPSGDIAVSYVQGRNVLIEYRDAEDKLERLPALAAELCGYKNIAIYDGSWSEWGRK